LRITVSRAFVADLDKARAALSHQIVDENLESVLHECVRRTLRQVEKKQRGAARKRTGAAPSGTEGKAAKNKPSRYVPVEVRAEVWRRDDGRCAFVGSDGHRCNSTHKVQFHHVMAFAKGGPATVENGRILCERHNRHIAENE